MFLLFKVNLHFGYEKAAKEKKKITVVNIQDVTCQTSKSFRIFL